MSEPAPQTEVRVAVLEAKVEALTGAVKELSQNVTTHFERSRVEQQEAARFDRKEQADLLEKQQKNFMDMLMEERKRTDEKYKDFAGIRQKLWMILGALALLGWMAKPYLDKLLSLK